VRRNKILIGSILLLAARVAHGQQAEGELRCEKIHKHGMTEKIVTYTASDGKTYALNGYARVRAHSRHWIKASHALSPAQTADLLSRGLKLCDLST
jgi:hypothetical protein